MKKLFKKLAWLLKGSPRCKHCGRIITSAKDIKKGYGPKCRKEIEAWLMGGE